MGHPRQCSSVPCAAHEYSTKSLSGAHNIWPRQISSSRLVHVTPRACRNAARRMASSRQLSVSGRHCSDAVMVHRLLNCRLRRKVAAPLVDCRTAAGALNQDSILPPLAALFPTHHSRPVHCDCSQTVNGLLKNGAALTLPATPI